MRVRVVLEFLYNDVLCYEIDYYDFSYTISAFLYGLATNTEIIYLMITNNYILKY